MIGDQCVFGSLAVLPVLQPPSKRPQGPSGIRFASDLGKLLAALESSALTCGSFGSFHEDLRSLALLSTHWLAYECFQVFVVVIGVVSGRKRESFDCSLARATNAPGLLAKELEKVTISNLLLGERLKHPKPLLIARSY